MEETGKRPTRQACVDCENFRPSVYARADVCSAIMHASLDVWDPVRGDIELPPVHKLCITVRRETGDTCPEFKETPK